ncbi:MAG: FdhD [Geobacteraceae bacterium]|nr:MAG: FdhD [Geobacteraceae bacterium]
MTTIYRYDRERLEAVKADMVREFPLVLTVNGKELATLIASPHELRFLVAGFLRMQGFVESADDFLVLSVCNDLSAANVRIRGEVPERLTPTLTSGCGAGVTFNLPQACRATGEARNRGMGTFAPEEISALMNELARRAELYKRHGGIHSAAAGDGKSLFLFAEDIGRHNTLDRIAGEALLKNIDLTGKMLVTSGRISIELVAKALRLGLSLIASRTSPTDLAVKMGNEAGITLIGYVRGGRFNVYSHPERLRIDAPCGT